MGFKVASVKTISAKSAGPKGWCQNVLLRIVKCETEGLFEDLYEHVHIDEKLFYLIKQKVRVNM